MITEYKSCQSVRRWLKQNMGIKVSRYFLIHHIDHNPQNNQINNLIRLTEQEHKIAHLRRAPTTPSAFRAWLNQLRQGQTPDWV